MSEGVKLTKESVRTLDKIVRKVRDNDEALMYSTLNGSQSARPLDDTLPILVYLISTTTGVRLYKSKSIWYRFSINEFYSNFTIPVTQSVVPDMEVIYQFKVSLPLYSQETDWITVPTRESTDTDATYFKKFGDVTLDAIRTLSYFSDKDMNYEYASTVPSEEDPTSFNMVQFTFGEETNKPVYAYDRDRPLPIFMINKVKFRRQRYSPQMGEYYTYGPPSKSLFINPFYFETTNLFFSSEVRIPVTLLTNPYASNFANAYLSSIIGTEAIAYLVPDIGYVITNTARRINFPLYSNPVIVYPEE